MGKPKVFALACVMLVMILSNSGCVERELTINTEPQGAVVTLNDEEIGTSPVTVSFNWYGDYNVRINKEGYETLKTHRELKGPWYDKFPFDFFAQILNPKRIVNSYEWTFTLAPKQLPTREALIEDAEKLKKRLPEDQEPAPSKVSVPAKENATASQPSG
jgi:hypothetical protein